MVKGRVKVSGAWWVRCPIKLVSDNYVDALVIKNNKVLLIYAEVLQAFHQITHSDIDFSSKFMFATSFKNFATTSTIFA